MIETKEIKVGEDKFKIQSLPATRALQIAAKLAKVFGGAGAGFSDIPLKVSEINEAVHIGNMVQGILQNIDADEAPELIRTIVKEVLVYPQFEGDDGSGRTGDQRFLDWYEGRFSGKDLRDLPILLYEIFAHNYGDPVAYIKKALAQAIEGGWLAPSGQSSETTDTESKPAS